MLGSTTTRDSDLEALVGRRDDPRRVQLTQEQAEEPTGHGAPGQRHDDDADRLVLVDVGRVEVDGQQERHDERAGEERDGQEARRREHHDHEHAGCQRQAEGLQVRVGEAGEERRGEADGPHGLGAVGSVASRPLDREQGLPADAAVVPRQHQGAAGAAGDEACLLIVGHRDGRLAVRGRPCRRAGRRAAAGHHPRSSRPGPRCRARALLGLPLLPPGSGIAGRVGPYDPIGPRVRDRGSVARSRPCAASRPCLASRRFRASAMAPCRVHCTPGSPSDVKRDVRGDIKDPRDGARKVLATWRDGPSKLDGPCLEDPSIRPMCSQERHRWSQAAWLHIGGAVLDEATFANDPAGHAALDAWARRVAPGATLGFEGSSLYGAAAARTLERTGHRVREVPPHLSRRERGRTRRAGKSDPGDALAIARVTAREADLPPIRRDDPTSELGLLLAAREDLVAEATRIRNRLHADLVVLVPGYGAQVANLVWARHQERARRALRGLRGVQAELALGKPWADGVGVPADGWTWLAHPMHGGQSGRAADVRHAGGRRSEPAPPDDGAAGRPAAAGDGRAWPPARGPWPGRPR